jgi:Rps23 Pro-64 3,4-dihydroxylase Tpa1-like proline 4-hydroxylase
MLKDLKGDFIINESVLSNSLNLGAYKTASPYPHIIIDDLFVPDVLDKIIEEWALNEDVNHESHNDGTFVKNKISTAFDTTLPLYTEYFLYQLSRPYFLKYLQELTGISGLIPDPYNFGGGLHETYDKGKLAIHADYNKHFMYKLDRRLNLLIYLNKDWTPEMRGELELWDANVTESVKKVLPVFNRTVIFSTTSISYHGQPEPINCGPNRSRRSIALYYYSYGRPEESNQLNHEHSTLWKTRPGKGF